MKFNDYLSLLEQTWEPEKRNEIFSTILAIGSFDELANYRTKVYEAEQIPKIFEAMLKKGNYSQLFNLYKITMNPDERLKIETAMAKILNTQTASKLTNLKNNNINSEKYDVFISHASEDKDIFVRQLAKELSIKNIKVWYDELTLKIGDSLHQSIEKGLANSTYGIVVLSKNFFAKKYPQDELNGLAIRERKGNKVILPIWLDVDEEYISQFAPMLADRIAARASDGMSNIISALLDVIKP
jgi:hypothetical protein